MNAVYDGPQACICWTPVYAEPQEPPVPAEPVARAQACADCAYRPDSPERNNRQGVSGDTYALLSLVHEGQPFYCHQGIRQPVALVHPSGAHVRASKAEYDPPIIDRVPYKADGTPANICAGWSARRAAFLAATAQLD